MFRLGTLLAFATIALGQVPERSAYLSIETTGDGDVNGTLIVPVIAVPAGLPAAFAHAVGCDGRGLAKSSYESRIVVRCPGARPSALAFQAAIRPSELAPLLREAGIGRMDLVLMTPHFRSLRIEPALDADARASSGYHRAQYSIDQLPARIVIDGGFEVAQVQAIAGAALGFILAPLLLLLLRPRDPLRLRVQTEGIFVLAWICWIWVLAREGAGALLSYFFAHWAIGPLLVLLAPPLIAVWIGSRLAAVQYARITPNGVGAEDYRRARFWSGAAAACFASTFLSVMLLTFTKTGWSLAAGVVLTLACLLWIRRTGRGKSHPLEDGDLRKRTFETAAKAGVKLRGVSILTSPTPRPPIALATRWGLVLLNESLLQTLSRREVDAVVCHELSHLHPIKRSALSGVYVLVVASVLGTQWIPNFADFIPIALLAFYFMIKAWRRAGERKADLDSVRWSAEPAGLITGLARVARAHGMPLDWGAPISWMLGHPPTMERIHAIARAGGLNESRIPELLEESRRDAADHYVEPQPATVAEDVGFSPAMRKHLQTRVNVYVLIAPVACGLITVWLLESIGLDWRTVFAVGSLFSNLVMYLGFDWVTGSGRDLVKRLVVARHGQGVFAGFSPAAEPRLFDGSYQYDLGLVRFRNGMLEFAGDRAHFSLDRRLIERVWLGDGPRHWTARKVVYIQCRPSPEAGPIVFSLQSLEAWYWPSTGIMAKRLYRQVDEWHKGSSSSATESPQPCALPQVEGSVAPFISFRTAVRSMVIYCGAAFVLASIKNGMAVSESWSFSDVLCPTAVCGVLALSLVLPRLNWGRFKPLTESQSRLSADS